MKLNDAQYYTMIYSSTLKCYEHRNPIKENISLSSQILLRNGFVFCTNIYGSQLSNEVQMNSLGSISNDQ